MIEYITLGIVVLLAIYVVPTIAAIRRKVGKTEQKLEELECFCQEVHFRTTLSLGSMYFVLSALRGYAIATEQYEVASDLDRFLHIIDTETHDME